MKSYTATKVKNNLGEFIDSARREPVSIVKHNRPVIVAMSHEEFEELKLLKLREIVREAQDNGDYADFDVENMTSDQFWEKILKDE